MKKLGLVIIAVFGFCFLNAQTQNNKGLYVDSDGELFSGVIEKTENNIKSDFTVKEGVIDGAATYYYASGKVMESGMFSKGQKDQKWIRYTETGATSAIAFYNLGKKAGTWIVYDENGKKRFEMNYTDGEKTGVWTNWDENGAIAGTKDYTRVN